MAQYSPKYNKGITIYSNYSDNYLCHICPNEPEEPWHLHLLTQEHSSRYDYFTRYFQDINLSFVTCKICDEWIDKSSIYSHAVGHKLIPWYRPDDELELLFKNFTSKHDNYYYCHLCELEISSWYNALYHADDFAHKNRQIHELRDFFVVNLNFPSAIYDSMISNFIFPKNTEQLVCIICYESIEFVYTTILDHIDEDSHKKAGIRFSESLRAPVNHNINNNNNNNRNLMRNLQVKWNFHEKLEIIEEEMEELNVKRVFAEKVHFTQCKICNSLIFGGEASVLHHNRSKDHVKKKRQLLHKSNGKILEDPVFKESNNYYLADDSGKMIDKNVIEIKEIFSINNYRKEETFFWCILCSAKFTNQRYVLQHIKTRFHLKELKKKPLSNEFEYFNCKNCSKEFHKFTEFSEEDHWRSRDHLENNADCLEHENNNNEEKEDENSKENGEIEGREGLPEGIEHIHDDIYLCTMCDRLFNDEQTISSHINTQDHMKNGPKVIFKVQESKFLCKICNNILECLTTLRQHLKSTRHRDNLNEKIKTRELPEGIKKWRKRDFFCTICDKIIENKELINEHVNLEMHQEKLKEFNDNNVYCRFISREIKSGHEVSKEVPKSSDKLDPEFHDSSRGKEVFFTRCTTCDCDILGEHMSLSEHNHSSLHAKKTRKMLRKHPLMKKTSEPETTKSTKKRYFMISPQPKIDETIVGLWEVAKGLYNGEKIFWCNICHSRVPGDVGVRQHLDGSRHRTNLQKAKDVKSPDGSNRDSTKNVHDEEMSDHLKSNGKQYNESEISLIEDLFSSEKRRNEDLKVIEAEKRRNEDLKVIEAEKRKNEDLKVIEAEKRRNEDLKAIEAEKRGNEDLKVIEPEKRRNEDLRVIEAEKNAGVSPDELKSNPEEVCKNHEKIDEIDEKKEITSFLTKLDAAIDKFCYASPQEEAEPPKPVDPEPTPSTSAPITEAETEKKLEKTPLPPPIYHRRNHKVESIECSICNVKVYGNYETSVQTEYRSHVSSKKHIESMEKWINTPRVVKLERPDMKLFKWLHYQLKASEPCHLCAAEVEVSAVHQHLTRHFWKRFVDPASSDEEEEKEEEGVPAETSESLHMHLNPEEFEAKARASDSPEQKSPNLVKKRLDIADAKAGRHNIYKIDDKQLKNIKIGAILSFLIDESIYCLVCQKKMDNCVQSFYEHLQSISHAENLKIIRKDDELFRGLPDQMSDLALACEFMEGTSEASVYCHACKIFLQNSAGDLRNHIEDKGHVKESSRLGEGAKTIYAAIRSMIERDYYSIQRYWCVLCDSIFHSESTFREHLRKKYHLNKLNYYAKKREKLIMDYCPMCATLWFGFSRTYSYHSQQKMHKFHKKDGFFVINKLPLSAENFLINKIEIDGILENEADFAEILGDLERTIGGEYPEARAHAFGSRICGIGRGDSDLDIFVDCESQTLSFYDGDNSTPEIVKNRMKHVWMSLNKNVNIWNTPETVLDARIPLIKTKHKPSGIECDLSFTNGIAVENTAVVRNYCVNYADCRKFIIFIKNWINHCELGGSKGINSYAVSWLVIYFLQFKKILPTVGELIEMSNVSRLICGWETGVADDFPVVAGDNFDKLLREIFRFYANFDYRNCVISPLVGESLKKMDFQEIGKLPVALNNYVKYVRSTEDPQTLRIDSPMCLQDPFELTQNVTKAVNKLTVNKFRIFCKLSADLLDCT